MKPASPQRGRVGAFLAIAVSIAIAGMLVHGCTPMHTAGLYRDPSRLSFPSITFSPPEPERVVLPNGMVLYLMEDHEVPLITIHAIIRTGGIFEPADKVGLAQITGEVMRTGGTAAMGPEELDRTLEYMGAILETSIGTESGGASLSVLTKDLEQGLDLFAQVLRSPAFAPEKVDLARLTMIESIRRQNDDPLAIASREFKRQVYTDDPRGRVKTIEGVERMTREDLIAFHRSFFFPENILMGVAGDFERDRMLEAISKIFGDWEQGSRPIPPYPVPKNDTERAVVYAPRPLPQSTILMGHLCCPKNDPDFFPMVVLNDILGEGFNSRLMREIRSNQGLAYSVGSFYRGDIDYGVFGAYAMTKSETTGKVIGLMRDEIGRLVEEGVTPEELDLAKDSIINNHIFSFSSTAGLVKQAMALEYDHLSGDYFEGYPERIAAVSMEDIRRVALRYLKPADAVIVVVGNREGFDIPIEQFGPVKEADLTIR